ncbi:hypothetical protein LOTGIDRAFT_165160 [Lottia gigantea]|uniref:Uncharacterized protein n=1 Tax=Lottia gigantea TaxID=225164 RepID=V3ZWH7_LOTGI|nr:hypothetical protein LOTGIDRAFT_165160 [Lottia gigantea]ESO88747.1 hypothetical protein LOTGIDRAFT_165160 [Lottia gigantea]
MPYPEFKCDFRQNVTPNPSEYSRHASVTSHEDDTECRILEFRKITGSSDEEHLDILPSPSISPQLWRDDSWMAGDDTDSDDSTDECERTPVRLLNKNNKNQIRHNFWYPYKAKPLMSASRHYRIFNDVLLPYTVPKYS